MERLIVEGVREKQEKNQGRQNPTSYRKNRWPFQFCHIQKNVVSTYSESFLPQPEYLNNYQGDSGLSSMLLLTYMDLHNLKNLNLSTSFTNADNNFLTSLRGL